THQLFGVGLQVGGFNLYALILESLDVGQDQVGHDRTRAGIAGHDIVVHRFRLPFFLFHLGPQVIRADQGIALPEDDFIHGLVYLFALFDQAVVIKQLGKDVVGRGVDILALVGFDGLAV